MCGGAHAAAERMCTACAYAAGDGGAWMRGGRLVQAAGRRVQPVRTRSSRWLRTQQPVQASARQPQCAAATVRSSQRGLHWERGRSLAWLPSQVISAGGPRMYRACRRGRETSAGGTRMYRACRRGDARTISRTSQQGREWCHQRNLRVPHPRVRSGTHALALATLYGRARGQRAGVRANPSEVLRNALPCTRAQRIPPPSPDGQPRYSTPV